MAVVDLSAFAADVLARWARMEMDMDVGTSKPTTCDQPLDQFIDERDPRGDGLVRKKGVLHGRYKDGGVQSAHDVFEADERSWITIHSSDCAQSRLNSDNTLRETAERGEEVDEYHTFDGLWKECASKPPIRSKRRRECHVYEVAQRPTASSKTPKHCQKADDSKRKALRSRRLDNGGRNARKLSITTKDDARGHL